MVGERESEDGGSSSGKMKWRKGEESSRFREKHNPVANKTYLLILLLAVVLVWTIFRECLPSDGPTEILTTRPEPTESQTSVQL